MRRRALPTEAERDAEPDAPYCAAALRPSPRELFASAGWRLVEHIGAGGSSEVWHARDVRGRSFALKIPHPDSQPGESLARLAREHEVLEVARHGHIVATRGVVEHRGACALALEYLPGGDLVALAGAHPRHWLRAARSVHAALAHLHARGYAHRDVKARNVLFDAQGRAHLIDFASALPLGAPAPSGGTTAAHRRAACGSMVTAADDAYAYAVLLYELLAGRLPYGPAGRSIGGLTGGGAPPARWPCEDRTGYAAELAARVLDVLEGDAAEAPGLSAFADVLESAAAAELRAAGY